ncbi:MAG: hypothetical protein GTO45_04220 [Candidatus Aminicenantes bacterium]|nr:hypothetical protein [Candidatus Aminicenantes bacterium]NIM82276.1 hypothetical protein [Candidatus Aminicenantes bacterium]NIN17274.1 hypothetical protein [Candidatus Aminicenantes bacterium]NIN41143.1 hypothetical protein [Candidatus Aminicenantes bacterium]NIN83942.1 hypothetical protein [Candidatus Aminicenantes bacterium]
MSGIKKDLALNILMGVLAFGIILVSISRFMPEKEKHENFRISEIEKVQVTGIDSSNIGFRSLVGTNESVYCMIFEQTNCDSCIYHGIEDLKSLQKEGKSCFALLVHDYLDEFKGYAGTFNFSPFYMLKKKDFYEYFSAEHLPVIVKINNGRVKSFRYITP